MKLYDISQEVFSCSVFPGDSKPEKQTLCSIGAGDLYNLTAFSMCAHNGTHIDAPFHFLKDGATVDLLDLEACVGQCLVVRHPGPVTASDARSILKRAGNIRRILIAGPSVVTEAAAEVFAAGKLLLLGNESQTVGPEEAPMAVHKLLLGQGTVLLEGVVLKHVPEGRYLLNAAPLNLAGVDGAPCRAWLLQTETLQEESL